MPCYDDDSTHTLAPSLIEFVNDDSSVDSLSSAVNTTYLSSLENYQTEVDITIITDQKLSYPQMSHLWQFVLQTS